ncbi:coenzyme F390 synthetase [Xenococcus sp. PCC 7305]|uniref:phenylacetate--CoA ligase family protein n=1 Tax=Xenococcus sp. PCC 7305 TaxID=102125 RepID=UPI0002ACFA25|nr:phenylacetate--CoA ligase family protein [Xenococcus sp. PCC 7305]ELS00435.1 coenzyme F390 synthetase [Xenococcus sp. PCC 7305]
MRENSKQQRLQNAWQEFVTPLETKLKKSLNTDPEQAIINLFHQVSNRVPAYQKFLEAHQINPQEIKTIADFQSLPLIDKENYIRAYPLGDRCYEGEIASCDLIAVSSGSTGQPTFWPRFITDEYQIATRFEQIFQNSFQADQGNTLAVVCFSLGTWVGGIYTANCCRHLATKGYPLTVVTPGSNKTEILRIIEQLAPLFERVVLLGYPPFLKDVIDTGLSKGIPWQNYGIKLVMAGEVFSEEWRDLVAARIGSTNPCYDFASLYGTADAGVLGNETALSICIRRFFASHPDRAREFFGESRLPTLVQYDPTSRYFEVQDGTLLFSGNNGIPLIRYHIADTGGIISYQEMLAYLNEQGFNPLAELASGDNSPHYPLPFVYVFGRANFVLSYYGANIYPENIQVGLEQTDISDSVTGKFVMEIRQDQDHNSYLAIAVELAIAVNSTQELQDAIANSIHAQLIRLNSEYANYVPSQRQLPDISLYNFGDPNYFPVGVKHRYTKH